MSRKQTAVKLAGYLGPFLVCGSGAWGLLVREESRVLEYLVEHYHALFHAHLLYDPPPARAPARPPAAAHTAQSAAEARGGGGGGDVGGGAQRRVEEGAARQLMMDTPPPSLPIPAWPPSKVRDFVSR